MFDDRELVMEFVNESREHLAQIESQLLDIEQSGENTDLALVNEVFRSVHSIKGAAGFMGFMTLGKLAHELENVLNLMRNGELVASSPIIDTLLKAADKLRWMIDNVDRSNEADISDHLAAMELIISGLMESESLAPAMQHGIAGGRGDRTSGRGYGRHRRSLAMPPAAETGPAADVDAAAKPQRVYAKPQAAGPADGMPQVPRPTPASASAWGCSTS